jgi:hypothetical protein
LGRIRALAYRILVALKTRLVRLAAHLAERGQDGTEPGTIVRGAIRRF